MLERGTPQPDATDKLRAVKAAMHRLAREIDQSNRFRPDPRAERDLECLEAVAADYRESGRRR